MGEKWESKPFPRIDADEIPGKHLDCCVMDDNAYQFSMELPGIEPGAELLTIDERAASGRYTGELIEKDRAKIDAILQLLAVGVGIRRIAASQHVSTRTVSLLRDRYSEKIATHKKGLARRFGLFAELGIDRAIEEVDEMDRDKLMISVGIATEKMQLLDGEATAIIGSTANAPSHEELRKQFDAILVEAQEMGCEAEGEEQTREALEVDPVDLDAGLKVGRIDNESTAANAQSVADQG